MSRAVRIVEGIHVPTKQKREQVVRLVACGLTTEQISFVLGCEEHEVRSNYEQELIHGVAAVTALVGAATLRQALKGDVNAQRFWLQSRARWTIPQHVELTGRDGGPVQVEHRRALVARVLALATPNKADATQNEQLDTNKAC